MNRKIISIIILLLFLPMLNFAQKDSVFKNNETSFHPFQLSKVYFNFEYGLLVSGKASEITFKYNFILSNTWGLTFHESFYNFNDIKNMPSDYNEHIDVIKHLFDFSYNPVDNMIISAIGLKKEFPIHKSVSVGFETGISIIKQKESIFYKYYGTSSSKYYYDFYTKENSAIGYFLAADIEAQLTGFLGLGLDLKSDFNSIHSYFTSGIHLTFWLYNRERRNAKAAKALAGKH